MPRIDSGSFSSGSGISIPWKAIGLLLFVLGAWGYVWYEYARLHPKPSPSPRSEAAIAAARRNERGKLPDMFAKLELTDQQKEQLSALAKETTAPARFRAEAMKVLTPEQRQKTQEIRKELADQRKEMEARRQAKMQKYHGGDAEYARAANKIIREQTEARKKAAEARKQDASPATPSSPAPGANK